MRLSVILLVCFHVFQSVKIGVGDDFKTKRQQFVDQHDYVIRHWQIVFKKIMEFVSEVIQTENGYETLTHLGTEIHRIVENDRGVFAKELNSQIRKIILDEIAQQNIIRIANTIHEVVFISEGYHRVITLIQTSISIVFDSSIIKAGHILFMAIQEIQQDIRFYPAYKALFEKIIDICGK